MSCRNAAVFGIYPTRESVDAAVETLRTKGFRNTDVSVLFRQSDGSKALGDKGIGWLAGIGVLAIPGVGPFIASGPFAAALTGLGAGGGVAGALIELGMPEYQAERHEERMRTGGILLSVHADDQDWTRKGKQVLEQTGAEDICSVGETRADSDNTDRPTRNRHVAASGEVVKH